MVPSERGSTSGYSIRAARSVGDLSELRSVWEEMQRHHEVDLDFYLMILGSRINILRPHVIVLYRGGLPEAMLIGRIEQRPLTFRLGYRTVFRAEARFLTVLYGGRLGRESAAYDEAFVAELISCLRRGEADLVLLSHLRLDSPLYQSATRTPSFLYRDHLPVAQPHWRMSLSGNVEDVWKRLPGNFRKHSRYEAKRLMQSCNGNVRVKCFRAPDTLDCMIQTIERVARRSYQRGLGVGFIDSGETRRRMDFESRRGWLRAYVLYAGDDPWAFWVGTLYRGTFHSNFLGYDPMYRQYSPGTFVMMRGIEDLCTIGAKEIDLGLGDAFYKERFGTESCSEASVYIFPPTYQGAKLSLVKNSTVAVSQATQQILRRTHLLTRVKRIWRDRLITK